MSAEVLRLEDVSARHPRPTATMHGPRQKPQVELCGTMTTSNAGKTVTEAYSSPSPLMHNSLQTPTHDFNPVFRNLSSRSPFRWSCA